MRRKIFIISTAMVICLLFSTVAYAATVVPAPIKYAFTGATSTKVVKNNTFTLAKGAVTISGSQTIKVNLSGDLPPIGTKVKYELFNAKTTKSCGSVEIAGNNYSFSKVKIGTAPDKGTYYIQVSVKTNSVTASGSGTVIQ